MFKEDEKCFKSPFLLQKLNINFTAKCAMICAKFAKVYLFQADLKRLKQIVQIQDNLKLNLLKSVESA